MNRRRSTALVVAAMALPSLWGSAAGAAPRPPGNNGTIKVEGEEMDKLHDNDPHVGCDFFLQWYGFDEGTRTTTATFAAHAPTGSGETLLTDTFTFEGHGSGNTLDIQRSFDLTSALAGMTPSHQGFHVKVTVETDGSQGADEKHKVFWVSGCGQAAAPETEESSTPPPPEETGALPETETTGSPEAPTPAPVAPSAPAAPAAPSAETTAAAPAAVESLDVTRTAMLGVTTSSPSESTAPATQVLGEQIVRAASEVEAQTRGALPRTGSSGLLTLGTVGLGLVAAGAALHLGRRRFLHA
jgi:LPXTG-motif cell wall-anchored protein